MKFISMFHSLMLLIAFSTAAYTQKAPDSTRQILTAILDRWHRDAASGNLEAYIGAMSPNGVYIGTDPSECWTTDEFRNFCKPHFAKGKTWNFRPVSRNIDFSRDKQTAWFDEILDTHMGICRGSGVLQMQEGVWKIEQYVLSAAIPNSLMKPVVKTKWGTDSLYLHYLEAGIKNPEQSLDTGFQMGYRFPLPALPGSRYQKSRAVA